MKNCFGLAHIVTAGEDGWLKLEACWRWWLVEAAADDELEQRLMRMAGWSHGPVAWLEQTQHSNPIHVGRGLFASTPVSSLRTDVTKGRVLGGEPERIHTGQCQKIIQPPKTSVELASV